MTLSQKLSDLRVKYAKLLKPDLAQVMNAHIERLRSDGALDRIVKEGQAAPAFELKDDTGQMISSKTLLARGPLVISFYRGSWCPYCVEELKALNDAYEQIRETGSELVVISPQTFVKSSSQARDLGLKFKILVDEKNAVGKAFGLVYSFSDDLKSLYQNAFKLDVSQHNGGSGWELPIPARFVIDSGGTVRDVKADPDYRYRPDPSDTIAVLTQLQKLSV